MTLPTSGALHLAQIGYEAQKPLLTTVDINNIELRKLCALTADQSQISFADFYGKTYGVGAGYGATAFIDLTGQAPGAVVSSNLIYITGISGSVSFALQCTQPAEYSINGGAWTDKSVLGTISVNNTLRVRLTTSSSYNTAVQLTASYTGGSKVWNVTTGTIQTYYAWLGVESNNTVYANGRTTAYFQGVAGTQMPTARPTWSNAGSWTHPTLVNPTSTSTLIGWCPTVSGGFYKQSLSGTISPTGSLLALISIQHVGSNPFNATMYSTYCTQSWQVEPTSNVIVVPCGLINGHSTTAQLHCWSWTDVGLLLS